MHATRHHLKALAAALLGLLLAGGVCFAEVPLETQVLDLQARNQALQSALAEANKGEKQATEELQQIRLHLEALGKNLLDGGDDRLIEAAADNQIAQERIAALEKASTNLVSSIQEYIRQAVVSDPDSRLRVETSLRELDAALGLRQKPRPDVAYGSLQKARIVSIDQESGLVVLNIGESQGAKIGMTFSLSRGQQPYGKAIIADVRRGVSGLFVENLPNQADSPRVGDLAHIETQPQ